MDEARRLSVGHTDETGDPTELLYRDALEIYERARREVTIPRKDGSHQKCAAVRYKQQIKKSPVHIRPSAWLWATPAEDRGGIRHTASDGDCLKRTRAYPPDLDARLVFGEDFSAEPERGDLRGRLRW